MRKKSPKITTRAGRKERTVSDQVYNLQLQMMREIIGVSPQLFGLKKKNVNLTAEFKV